MQDVNNNQVFKSDFVDYKIKIDDVLKIDITSGNLELMGVKPEMQVQPINSNRESLIYAGYQVYSDGTIYYPSIGSVYVKNKTLLQIRDEIYSIIKSKDIIVNPEVEVKLLNAHFVILGEVNNPGRYIFYKNNLTIFEAISMAGDLTISGKRKDVKLIRSDEDKRLVHNIDLTSPNIFESEYFQILSGDMLIINPNNSRVKNAGIIGNSGTLISLLSFILSSIIVIRSVN